MVRSTLRRSLDDKNHVSPGGIFGSDGRGFLFLMGWMTWAGGIQTFVHGV